MNSRATGMGVAGREAKPAGCLIPASSLPRKPWVLHSPPGQEQLQVCQGRCLHAHPQSQAFVLKVLFQTGRALGQGRAGSAPSAVGSGVDWGLQINQLQLEGRGASYEGKSSGGSAHSSFSCSFFHLLQKSSSPSQNLKGLRSSSTNPPLSGTNHVDLEPSLLRTSGQLKQRGAEQCTEAPSTDPEAESGPQLSVSAPKCAKKPLIASITQTAKALRQSTLWQ